MKTQVMLDLETLGNTPGSVIVSIGAVKFGKGRIADRFYVVVDAGSCVAHGLHMDVSAVQWWMKQDDAARKVVAEGGGTALPEALKQFAEWVADPLAEVWGNGSNFDNVLLGVAYNKVGQRLPWRFTNDRCYRTVARMRPDIAMERTGTFHNALNDAESQALHLMAVLQAIAETGLPPAPQKG